MPIRDPETLPDPALETSVAHLTDAEAAELGPLFKRVSAAADHPHVHVHVHVIARHHDQPAEWKGPGIFLHALGVDQPDEVTEARRNEIAAAVTAAL